MKIRTDFVTNSSSSSFILARKGELTEKQKDALVDYITEKMCGKKVLDPGATEEDIQRVLDDYYCVEDNIEDIKQALLEGKSIYAGDVVFECVEIDYAKIFQDIWAVLEKAGNGNFEAIDSELSY